MQAPCVSVSRHYAIVQHIIRDSVFVVEGDNVNANSIQFLHKCHEINHFSAISMENLTKVCVFRKID